MFKRLLLLLVTSIIIISCSGDSDSSSEPKDNFDREAMLSNLANNIIVPAFVDFKAAMDILKSSSETFTQTPNEINLNALRQAWYNAYKIWQHVAMFEIGKAEELQFVYFFNIYPLAVTDVEANIASGTYDLNHSNNHDAQGFPALDYLLYGIGANDTEILAKYTSDTNAVSYNKYITDIITKMDEVITAVVNDWNGAYKNSFITSSSNTATSSLNKFVNDYIFYYEKRLRANKFGIPAGNFSTTALPEKVEALYKKDISKELALEALNAVQNLFEGKSYNGSTTGESFKTYLESLNRNDLVALITNQFNTARTQINSLETSFYQQINTDNNQMTMAYDELQKAVVLLKVDMLQAFNISVDYVDADGD